MRSLTHGNIVSVYSFLWASMIKAVVLAVLEVVMGAVHAIAGRGTTRHKGWVHGVAKGRKKCH